MTTTPIILLAAGASSRMRGRDKLLEQINGQPLIRRQALLARTATQGQVIVALPPEPHARYDALLGLDVTRVPVPEFSEGINATLRTAFAALHPGTPCAMVMLTDMPDLTKNDLNTLIQATETQPTKTIWRGATQTGKPGHPIIFAASHFPSIATLHGDRGARDIALKAKEQTALVPLPDSDARADLDTPEDWANWRSTPQT